MNGVIGEIKEEWPILFAINKVDCLFRQACGQVSLVVFCGQAFFVPIDWLIVIPFHAHQFEVVMAASAHEFIALVEASIHCMPLEFGKILV